MESAPDVPRPTVASRWKSLSAKNRRRIVLASLFAVAIGARDLMLFAVASGMFALSELGAAPRAQATAA
jgi:hypothetical protein